MCLMTETDFPIFFSLKSSFLSLSRSKLTAVSCLNTFTQNLRGASHHKSWGLVLPFPSQTSDRSGKVAVNQHPHQEILNGI